MSSITTVGVLGAGTMGHGIAHVAAHAGCGVFLYDVSLDAAKAGLEKIQKNLGVGVEKKKVTPQDRDAALARITPVDTLDAMQPCQLVIEAIPEKLALKQETFERLSTVCGAEAIFASNTSSLSLTQIAKAAKHPGRVVGMHFFNPVHLMKLLELVRAEQTSDATLAAARAFGEKLGKTCIVVKDSPGFASSRLGVTLGLEAIRMVEQGVASAEDIDRAMELGYGHPMGPLRLGDLVGLDVRLGIAEYLHETTKSAVFKPPELLKAMVREGRLGKKAGRGFYTY